MSDNVNRATAENHAREYRAVVLLNSVERKAVRAAAKRDRRSLSDFMRVAAIDAAARVNEEEEVQS